MTPKLSPARIRRARRDARILSACWAADDAIRIAILHAAASLASGDAAPDDLAPLAETLDDLILAALESHSRD